MRGGEGARGRGGPPAKRYTRDVAYVVDINPDDPKSIDAALRTEWLVTNGLWGFAVGGALGVNTRRYHGLLVAATRPPVGRVVVLHSLIGRCIFAGNVFD